MVAVAKDHGLAFVANIGSGSVTVIDLALGIRVAQCPDRRGRGRDCRDPQRAAGVGHQPGCRTPSAC